MRALEFAGATRMKRGARHNEDGFLLAPDDGVALVFDGMGGQGMGELAPLWLDDTARAYLDATRPGDRGAALLRGKPGERPREWALRRQDEVPLEVLARDPSVSRVEALLREANRRMFVTFERLIPGMGATGAGLEITGDEVVIVHAGNVRALRLRGAVLEELTRDHTLANELEPGSEHAAAPEYGRVLLRAFGSRHPMQLDVRIELARAGDLYVLCTGGLHAQLSLDAIAATLRQRGDVLAEACEALCTQADEAGGADDCTVCLVRLGAL